jgi:short-subunit dehydrogenase
VIAIEPGPIKTEIWKKNLNKMDEFKDSDYYKVLQKADKIIENAERNALPVESISKLIAKCLVAKRPKTRYIVHKGKFVFQLMAYYFPDKLSDWLVHKTLSSTNRHRPI